MDQIVKRSKGFIHGHLGIESVQLVKVYVVGAQPPQRSVNGVEDVTAVVYGMERLRPGRTETLRRDHPVVPLAAHPTPDDFLRAPGALKSAAERVHVGGIKKSDPATGSAVQNRKRRSFITLVAKGHRTQAKS